MLLFHYLKVLFKVSIFLILFPPPVFSLFQEGKTNPQVSLGRCSSEVGFEDTDGVKNVEVVGWFLIVEGWQVQQKTQVSEADKQAVQRCYCRDYLSDQELKLNCPTLPLFFYLNFLLLALAHVFGWFSFCALGWLVHLAFWLGLLHLTFSSCTGCLDCSFCFSTAAIMSHSGFHYVYHLIHMANSLADKSIAQASCHMLCVFLNLQILPYLDWYNPKWTLTFKDCSSNSCVRRGPKLCFLKSPNSTLYWIVYGCET